MSNYVVRRTSKWSSTVTITTVDECSTMEEALNMLAAYVKEEERLVKSDWIHVTGFKITVDEKWDNGVIKTIADAKGGDYLE